MNVVASRPLLARWPLVITDTPCRVAANMDCHSDVLLHAVKLAMTLPGPTGAPTMQNRPIPNLPSPKLGQHLSDMPQVVKSQHYPAFEVPWSKMCLIYRVFLHNGQITHLQRATREPSIHRVAKAFR